MRILAGGRVLLLGQHQCPEFHSPEEALPEQFKILLCLSDGAERRRQIQAQLNRTSPRVPMRIRAAPGEPDETRAARTLADLRHRPRDHYC